MEDRATVYITCRRDDIARICGIMFGDGYEPGRYGPEMLYEVCSGVFQLEFGQMMCAANEQIKLMAARKIPFYGSHDAGCTYPAGVFACDGERFMLCDTLPDATGPALEIRSDSSFDPEDGRKALLYWELYKRAREAIGLMAPAMIS